jgi:hypothetical protein
MLQAQEHISASEGKNKESHFDSWYVKYPSKGATSIAGKEVKEGLNMSGETATFLAPGSSTLIGEAVNELQSYAVHMLQKKSILSTKKTNAVFNLLQQDHQAQNGAHDEIYKIVKNKNITGRAERVAEKCWWYINKIHRLEEDLNQMTETLKLQQPPEARKPSSLRNCDDAYDLAFAINYLFKQYTKLIVYLTYFIAILLQVDTKALSFFKGNVAPGSVVSADTSKPAVRPPHMRTDVFEKDTAMHY